MTNFNDRSWSGFGLSLEVGSGSACGQHQTGSETLLYLTHDFSLLCWGLSFKPWHILTTDLIPLSVSILPSNMFVNVWMWTCIGVYYIMCIKTHVILLGSDCQGPDLHKAQPRLLPSKQQNWITRYYIITGWKHCATLLEHSKFYISTNYQNIYNINEKPCIFRISDDILNIYDIFLELKLKYAIDFLVSFRYSWTRVLCQLRRCGRLRYNVLRSRLQRRQDKVEEGSAVIKNREARR